MHDGRTGAQHRDHVVVALRLVLLHDVLEVPFERTGQHEPERGIGARLAGAEVRGKVDRLPARAEGGRVGTELLEGVAQVVTLPQEHVGCAHGASP